MRVGKWGGGRSGSVGRGGRAWRGRAWSGVAWLWLSPYNYI
ncbi:MAG: hypothetical protein RR846_04530 [Oscillospiraceae bacterium]